MATLLNQGAYGCIYYPGFTCKGNISKEKKYVTKLEIKDKNSVNEIEISNIIKKIKNYQKLFGPIVKSCDIKLNAFNNKSTNLSDCDVVNNYEFIQNDFKLIYINYINGTDIDKYIDSLEVPSIYLTTFINTFHNILNSIKLLNKNDIIHFDLHAGNILYDLNTHYYEYVNDYINIDESNRIPSPPKDGRHLPTQAIWVPPAFPQPTSTRGSRPTNYRGHRPARCLERISMWVHTPFNILLFRSRWGYCVQISEWPSGDVGRC